MSVRWEEAKENWLKESAALTAELTRVEVEIEARARAEVRYHAAVDTLHMALLGDIAESLRKIAGR